MRADPRTSALLAIGFVLSFACYAGLALFYVWLAQRIVRNRYAVRAMRGMRVTSTNAFLAAVLFVGQWIIRVFDVEPNERRARLRDLALLLVGIGSIVAVGICIERWS